MSARLEVLAREKELLLMRSALCRLRLRRRANDARASLPWNRAALAVATAPTIGRLALGPALSLAGVGRITRLVVLAGRIVLLAKLAVPVIAYMRGLAPPPSRGIDRPTSPAAP
jgi:hypothetical protein